MIIKCPNCSAALTYDIESDGMTCKYCGSFFSVDSKDMSEDLSNNEMMEIDIYNCSTCGAELIINDVESSTYCAYCGQPTIVWNRVSKRLRPDYILPFKVEKEEALAKIKKRLKSGFFIPKKIKNFEVDTLKGIYVPFWIYEMDYHDKQYLQGEVGSGKNKWTSYFFREADASFDRITVDASKSFNDNSSQRLEPFDIKELVPFNQNYFSGFYADCSDEDAEKMKKMATSRAKELFDQQVEKTIDAEKIKIIDSNPTSVEKKHTYVMLPVWFLVFNEDKKKYTIMVNGQTGKMVGAVPYNKVKASILLATVFTLSTSLLTLILYAFLVTGGKGTGQLIGLIVLFGIASWVFGHYAKLDYKLSQQLTSANEINKFVSDRQEEAK